MKKCLLMVVLAVFAISASAQIDTGFRTGLRANLGMSNITGFDGDKLALNYGVNFIVEYNFTEHFYLGSGLGFEDFSHKEEGVDGIIHAWNLTLPIHLGGRVSTGSDSYFFFQAGPQVSYGLLGSDIEWYYSSSSTNIYDVIDRFDVGVGGRLGFEFNKVQIGAGVNYGLMKLVEDEGHNFNFNLSIGYMF